MITPLQYNMKWSLCPSYFLSLPSLLYSFFSLFFLFFLWQVERVATRGRRSMTPSLPADLTSLPRSTDLASLPTFLPSPRRLTPPSSPAVAVLPSQAENGAAATQVAGVDVLPCFVVKSYGPRFLQRWGPFASKTVVLVNPIVEVADLLLAHWLCRRVDIWYV